MYGLALVASPWKTKLRPYLLLRHALLITRSEKDNPDINSTIVVDCSSAKRIFEQVVNYDVKMYQDSNAPKEDDVHSAENLITRLEADVKIIDAKLRKM